MGDKLQIDVRSEIGELEGVILHTPGQEVEDMTPQNAERALYSDILNLGVASREYAEFQKVLEKTTRTFQVTELLQDILDNENIKESLLKRICANEHAGCVQDYLRDLPARELARQLIQGVPMKKDNLSRFLSKERYSLQPLHNFFFTRDASVSVNNNVLIASMASQVREREAIIMEAIFNFHPAFNTKTVNPMNYPGFDPRVTIEGGDILVARKDILLIGIGARTTSQGIDFILEYLKDHKITKNLLIQELPQTPESFIHLDMVFTFLDHDSCLIYEPLILNPNRFRTIHIFTENGDVSFIREEKNIPDALKKLGMELKLLKCGGDSEEWIQEREQWHSGANFFALGPGKVIGYERNVHTIEELNKNGFQVLRAKDIIREKADIRSYQKYVITIAGSELARGGGGCRCMTMPVRRKPLE